MAILQQRPRLSSHQIQRDGSCYNLDMELLMIYISYRFWTYVPLLILNVRGCGLIVVLPYMVCSFLLQLLFKLHHGMPRRYWSCRRCSFSSSFFRFKQPRSQFQSIRTLYISYSKKQFCKLGKIYPFVPKIKSLNQLSYTFAGVRNLMMVRIMMEMTFIL